jgi:hypothetical protein
LSPVIEAGEEVGLDETGWDEDTTADDCDVVEAADEVVASCVTTVET